MTNARLLPVLLFTVVLSHAADQRPNILFIAIDDCKPMLGCYGNDLIKTPNMDRIAKQGVVFLNNHCQWAVCGPSRASITSGLMPETVGVMGFTPMRVKIPDLVTLPQYLRENGYETAARGKINDPRCVGKIVDPKSQTENGRKTDDLPSWSIPYKPHPFQDKPKNCAKYTFNKIQETRTYNGVPKTGPFPEPLQKELIHGYYACVSFIDFLVGRLTDELKALGKDQNTIIVIWGDHGFHLGDHAEWGKHTNIEQATRSPLIIAGAMVKKQGLRTNSPSMFLDVYPTLCHVAGLPVPNAVQGRSLVPIMNGDTEKVRNGAISLYRSGGAMGYAYRTERYRYIEWCSPKAKKVVARELYDYQEDPMETANIAVDERLRPLMTQLAAQLREEAVGCPLLKASGQ